MSTPLVSTTFTTLVLLMLAGCATPYRNALPSAAAPQMASTAGVLAVAQHEIGTSINSSNMAGAMGGGLLFALVDAAANSTSAKRTEGFAANLRQSLLDFSFEKNAAEVLGKRFAAGNPSPVSLSTVVAAQDKTSNDLAELVAPAKSDAVLVVFAKYFLDPQFTTVVVSAEVVVVAKSPALQALATKQRYGKTDAPVLYRNGFQTTWAMSAGSQPTDNKRENNVAAWAASNGQAARSALLSAASEIAAMLQWDLGQPAKPDYKPADKNPRADMIVYYDGSHLAMRGALVHTEGGRTWVQNVDGRLYGQR